MNPKIVFSATAHLLFAVILLAPGRLYAAQLLEGGDFEQIQLDELEAPILDSFGNEQAAFWFRSEGTGQPLTELVNPNNMNNAAGDSAGDDSDGNGTNSAALNFVDSGSGLGVGTDWRSLAFETLPGEKLIFSFDFKFIDVPDEVGSPGSGVLQGFTAQIRSFDGVALDGGTSGTFRGEESPAVNAIDFTNDVWHSTSFLIEVPALGTFTDIRMSASLFSPPFMTAGRIFLDNIQVNQLLADFDDDNKVLASDLSLWETAYGNTDVGDSDGDGDSDGADFLEWQREFGLGVGAIDTTSSLAAFTAVPEPSSVVLLIGASVLVLLRRSHTDLSS